MGKTTINIIGVLGVITTVFAGYYLYTQQSTGVQEEQATADMLSKTQAFIGYGKTLSEVNLELSFFEDERFRSLKNHSTPVQERPVGRDNPFQEPAVGSASLSNN